MYWKGERERESVRKKNRIQIRQQGTQGHLKIVCVYNVSTENFVNRIKFIAYDVSFHSPWQDLRILVEATNRRSDRNPGDRNSLLHRYQSN